MRQAALTYADQLQDFICIQITTRSADRVGTHNTCERERD